MSVSLARRFVALFVLLVIAAGGTITTPTLVFAQTTPPAPTAPTSPPSPSAQAIPDTCGWGDIFNPNCWARTIVWIIGTPLMLFSGWILGLAGTLFNFLIDFTVIQFGHYYATHIKQGLEAAWVVLRDLANIAIIGAFVFVAISTILGIDSFGVRRFIARILIAAILINFSLFFAKFAIDVSHIVARAFEVGIAGSRPTQTVSLASVDAPSGIAGAFLQQMKITSVWDSGSVIDAVAKNTKNAWVGLLYAVLVSTLFIAAAVILLYGSFLLLVRAVVLIMLLLASALAFGAIAIPGKEAEKWRGKWLDEFVKNVLFAPLLLMFLWATITITSKMGASTGSLADLATKPGSALGLGALVNYAIVLGLLFLSIKMAKSLSTSGSTLNKVVGGKLGAFLGGAASFAGTNTAGRLSNRLYLSDFGKKMAQKSTETGMGAFFARRMNNALVAGRTGSYNPKLAKEAAVKYGKDFAKAYGLDTGGKGGVAAGIDRANKRAEAREGAGGAQEKAKKAASAGESRKEGATLDKATKAAMPSKDDIRGIVEDNLIKTGLSKGSAAKAEANQFKDIRDAVQQLTEATRSGSAPAITAAEAQVKFLTGKTRIDDARTKAVEMMAERRDTLEKRLMETGALPKAHKATERQVLETQKVRAADALTKSVGKYAGDRYAAYSAIQKRMEEKKQTGSKSIVDAIKSSTKTP